MFADDARFSVKQHLNHKLQKAISLDVADTLHFREMFAVSWNVRS
jgi:hypothetical protein